MTNSALWPIQWKHLLATLLTALSLASCGKQVAPAPRSQPPPPFEYLGAWGEKGNGPGKLDAPVAFAGDSLGNIFFVDPEADFVHKFASRGTPLLSFEDPQVRHAAGIAVDSGGAIYVVDAERGNVLIFFPDGTYLRGMRFPPQPHFRGPLGITVDNEGNIYVVNPKDARVDKFDNRGRLASFWRAGQGAAVKDPPSSVATAQDGSVFVAYFSSGRIERYSLDGTKITSWSNTDVSSGGSHPIAAFAVGEGFVFTFNVNPAQIRVWSLGGQRKADTDLGERVGPIASPQIVVTSHSELLVFDPSIPRVFWFRMHLETMEQR